MSPFADRIPRHPAAAQPRHRAAAQPRHRATARPRHRAAAHRRHRVGVILLFVAAFTIAGTSAWAYWTTSGTGTASASTGTMNAPTGVTVPPTNSNGSVPVSWTASGGILVPQGYYVTRVRTSDSTTALACGSSPASLITLGLSCTDLSVPDGAFHYTVTAVYNTWTATSASSSDVTVSVPSKLAFTTNPSGSTGGAMFGAQPVVTVQDAGGNTTTGTNAVTLSVTGGGATLTCTANTKAAVLGVAAFAGCAIDRTGTYTLTATSAGLTGATSANVTITVGPATKLAFTTNPSASTGGAVFGTQPVVTVQDAGGNTVTTSAASVTLTITTPAGATLTCTTNPNAAASGVDAFTGCRIDKTGTYTLTATSAGLTNAVSNNVIITVGPATQLAFTTNPSASTGGAVFGTQPVVTVQDAGGNTVTTSAASVTLTITTPAGATLTCTTNPNAAASGVDAFTGCRIDKTGTYTLTATSAGLTNAVSNNVIITVGPATKLAFTTSPSNAPINAIFATQPVVTVQDAGGNTVTTSAASVTLTITTPAGATLTCTTNPKAAVSGVDVFAGCKINATGTYTLTATSAGLTSAVSTSFSISGAATKLAFTTSPSGSTGGIAFGTQPVVTVQDAGGNTTAGATAVTLAITTPAGATLICSTNPQNAVFGVASFAGCSINKPGTYTLTATSGALTSAASTSFTITLGPAIKLAFTTNPSSSTGGIAFGTQPVITVQDAGGNTVTTSVASVTLTITTPAGATLTCTTNPKNAVAGVDAFTGCGIDKIGTYTLTAASAGLTNAVSSNVTITLGSSAMLGFTTSPSNSPSGIAFGTQPVVTVQDAGGNTRTSSSRSITLNITTPAGATLTCTANPTNASAGVATFAGCKINLAGTYTLTATSAGLTDAVSTTFTIS